ncbi:serine/threonine-protein kinase [Pseudoduganella aquatica]|uniref:non-specific serine/threonine protein kinase n=1 Tax=Pseudoduganella aquatica TaxID=2660641 RepID=A0A7X4HH92_9BURK|nr:serine/threonine-protein kinase [Pseudoduganella aquatica]MYN11130.1 protein kinase [Pseudoduganella aquatica]
MENQAAEVTSPPPDVPQFQHYQILARLGAGGHGEVYEGWDSRLRRKVAIKRHRALDPLRDPASLVKEARMTASLHHPAFAQIYSIEQDDEGWAIVMELIAGQTWRQLAQDKEHPLDLPTVLGWMGQLAVAMEAAHESGLIHGDLKPSNLMLDPAGKVRILDLGLAFHDDAQATTSVMQLEQQGTIAYMAPEVLLGAAPGRQSDIYAMGVILFELATGARPFGNMSGLALAAAQMQSSSNDWTFPDTLPEEIIQLIRALTARRLDQRLANMNLVKQRTAACIDYINNDTGDSAGNVATKRSSRFADKQALVRNWKTFAAGAILLVSAGCWLFLATDSPLGKVNPPFSKAQAISRALAALQQSDQPERLEAATRDFTAILERDPDNAAAVAGMSLVYSYRYLSDSQDETWLQRATASAQQALKLDGQLALSHAAQAWVLSKQGKREQALAECERALALEPGHYFGTLGKAVALRKLRRFDEAKQWLEQAIQRNPGERVFADELGSLHFDQGNYAAAEQAFRRSMKLQPDSAFAYANLNATLLRLNRSEEGLQVLQQGLQVRPNGVLYTSLGNALFARGDYVGAAEAFDRAVTPPAGNPNNYLRWANLGDTLLWIPGKAGQAKDAYRKALKLLEPRQQIAPNDSTLLSRMGLYSVRAGDNERGIDLLRKATSLAPSSPDVHFRTGLAYELLGKRELALEALAQAKKNGYPASAIASEPDLVALRRDTRYMSLSPDGVK